jgi:hypothetical protein
MCQVQRVREMNLKSSYVDFLKKSSLSAFKILILSVFYALNI